jgi:hypothetical protein
METVLHYLQEIAKTHGNPGYSEAEIEADIRALLHAGKFLDDQRAALQSPTADGTRRRIDIQYGQLVVECKKTINSTNLSQLKTDENQLLQYLITREGQFGGHWSGILSDGVHWRHYRVTQGQSLQLVSSFNVDSNPLSDKSFSLWLGSALPSERGVRPTAETISGRLGANAPAHSLVVGKLIELLEDGTHSKEVTLKKDLWKKLLKTAFGKQFDGGDALFADHTYLVILGILIARKVLGYENLNESSFVLLSGESFNSKKIFGVGEAGFFDWVNDLEGGKSIVYEIALQVDCFDWTGIDHDVLKILYQSVLSEDVRRSLGEYYTPDWLADKMVKEVVTDPLNQRVMDPSCGSGTFLFWAIQNYFEAAEKNGIPLSEAVDGVTSHIFGIDIHPVSTALAQVTYLLAIGTHRLGLRSATKPFSVPVYLGDSIKWDEPVSNRDSLFASTDLVIRISDGHTLFDDELRFPDEVAARDDFDSLVTELSNKASQRERGSSRPKISKLMDSYTSNTESRKQIETTYNRLCDLRDEDRDHIWGFYIRNQAKPSLLSRTENRMDVLVGNPPWLSYRYMPEDIKARFKERSIARELWTGGKNVTHQDLSAFFIVISSELYLKNKGHFAFVTPHSVLKEAHYEGFRTGRWSTPFQENTAHLDKPWSLEGVRGDLFPVPAAVILGQKSNGGKPRELPLESILFTGIAPSHGSWSENEAAFTFSNHDFFVKKSGQTYASPYAERFKQGASLVPRSLIFVEQDVQDPLARANQRAVVARKGSQDKKPWKELNPLHGLVEENFIFAAVLGESLLPFVIKESLTAVIPWSKSTNFLNGADQRIDDFPGLATWWRQAEKIWETNKTAGSKLSLLDRIDYQSGITNQMPAPAIRVIYTTSGTHLASAIVRDPRVIVDTSLYWGAVASENEASYLCAILNTPSLSETIKPYQSIGQFGARHFHKYVWMPPIPLFNPKNERHLKIAELGIDIEQSAKNLPLATSSGFQKQRKTIRESFVGNAAFSELDRLVGQLLILGNNF